MGSTPLRLPTSCATCGRNVPIRVDGMVELRALARDQGRVHFFCSDCARVTETLVS